MDITTYSITVFITQLIFIGCRTWNVKAIANHNIFQAMLSGGFVHIAWLVSIAIGVESVGKIMQDFQLEYIPVLICSLAGGLFGTYISLVKHERKTNKKTEKVLKREESLG